MGRVGELFFCCSARFSLSQIHRTLSLACFSRFYSIFFSLSILSPMFSHIFPSSRNSARMKRVNKEAMALRDSTVHVHPFSQSPLQPIEIFIFNFIQMLEFPRRKFVPGPSVFGRRNLSPFTKDFRAGGRFWVYPNFWKRLPRLALKFCLLCILCSI